MANYTKATDFAAKDALASGNANKIVRGSELDDEFSNIQTAVNSKGDINSPTFTGIPLAPTAAANTNTTQIATTAFVYAERSNTATLTNKTINLADNTLTATSAQVAAAVTDETGSGALVFASSPTLSGTPLAPTAAAGTNTTQIATTAHVYAERSNTATLTNKTLSSPALTGTPTAPTAASGTNNTQIATTAFVTSALSAAYPVGSIYMNASSSTNPATLLGFGTWTALAAGRMLMGAGGGYSGTGGSADAIVVAHTHTGTTGTESATHYHAFSGTTATNGAHTHTVNAIYPGYADGYDSTVNSPPEGITQNLTTSSAGSHNHTFSGNTGSDVGDHTHSFTSDSTGSSGTNANLPPYLVVYMWQRTA